MVKVFFGNASDPVENLKGIDNSGNRAPSFFTLNCRVLDLQATSFKNSGCLIREIRKIQRLDP